MPQELYSSRHKLLKTNRDSATSFGTEAAMFSVHSGRIDMSFLQGVPESGQLLMFGVSLLLLGVTFRKIRKMISDFRSPIPASQQPEPRQS
jgi:hypothetical protein